MSDLLDNVTWHTLAGPHAVHAVGDARVRRYSRGFSPIVGFADPVRANLADLLPYCEPGEQLYSDGWSGAVPDDWQIVAESTMFRMRWDAPPPSHDPIPEAVALGPGHAAQALELAALTRPGPFGPRTIELGEYFGCFDGETLVAMAGERMHAGTLREISGVCTHPRYQGRGYARRLMAKLAARQLARGETPFLHVMRDNTVARALYRRIGFREHREAVVRVIARRA